MTEGREAVALEMIPKREVLKFLNSQDYRLGFNIRFKPYCYNNDSDTLKDVLGALIPTEPSSSEQAAASGSIVQTILSEMYGIGLQKTLIMVPSPRIMIGDYIKEPDMTMRPFRLHIGNGVLDDGFAFPFPTLVAEVAFAESRAQLLEDLEMWMSPKSSVQVVIGIKIHGRKEGRVRDTIQAIDAILYRRSAPVIPEQSVRFHPLQPGTPPPVLRVHLSDLVFGVARNRLPRDLQQRVARDETIEVDLGFVRESILQDG
jgi:hypothetical protein